MFRLDGKIALVTGGSRGIGRACAEALAEQGATVVVNYMKGEAAAKEVAEAIIAKGGTAEIAGFDVANTPATEAALDGIIKKLGKIDILVANAGISIDGLLLRLKDDELQKLFDTNVKGAITCARVAMKSMMRNKIGRIIFMSSVIGEMGNIGQTGYAITKAGLIGGMKSIAREYASRNVTVNAITPGFIATEMTSVMNEEMRQGILKVIPLGRMGSAREVATTVAFLASDEAAYVTGQVLRVNGGMYV